MLHSLDGRDISTVGLDDVRESLVRPLGPRVRLSIADRIFMPIDNSFAGRIALLWDSPVQSRPIF